jgi:hypothetical protein
MSSTSPISGETHALSALLVLIHRFGDTTKAHYLGGGGGISRGAGADGATYTEWMRETGLSKSTFKSARKRLMRTGHIEKVEKLYRVSDGRKGQGQGQSGS